MHLCQSVRREFSGATRKWLPGFQWQTVKRSYKTDVLRVLDTLSSRFDVVQYGHLDYHPDRYPLIAIKSRGWDGSLPCVLVTGGAWL